MWTYEQSTGLLSRDGEPLSHGYSGSPAGKNDPAQQAVHNVGPLPQGSYSIGAPMDTPAHGPYVLPLHPAPENEMFGRAGFLIHGGSSAHPGAASQGCIIVPRIIRELIHGSGDTELTVVA